MFGVTASHDFKASEWHFEIVLDFVFAVPPGAGHGAAHRRPRSRREVLQSVPHAIRENQTSLEVTHGKEANEHVLPESGNEIKQK